MCNWTFFYRKSSLNWAKISAHYSIKNQRKKIRKLCSTTLITKEITSLWIVGTIAATEQLFSSLAASRNNKLHKNLHTELEHKRKCTFFLPSHLMLFLFFCSPSSYQCSPCFFLASEKSFFIVYKLETPIQNY